MKQSLLTFLLLLVCPLYVAAETRCTGEIEGSEFIVDTPAQATGDILSLPRSYRTDTMPLSAVCEKEAAFSQTLMKEGWKIASPSFQGNRWVMADGAADIIALRAHVDAKIIKVKRALLYGESMGGGIVGWLAEQAPEGFSGAITLGAYLFEQPKGATPANPKPADYLPGTPGFVMVLLTNDVEAEGASSRG
ncbi:MAG: pimeloyl-ACP methyl ester carboxylesterase [Candidatus Azotimanducaceae bacterium]|jgi:pimeloyl-ACP methyl ester carboxylesterase